MKVAALIDDLLFGSKAAELLRAGGHEIVPAAEADVAVVDLTQGWQDKPALPALAVYSHVEADVRDRARDAGYELVVPRSRFMREGAELVTRLSG